MPSSRKMYPAHPSRRMLLFVFFFAAAGLCAQTERYYGLNLFPNFSNRRLIAFENISQAMIDSLEKREGYKPSYTAGFFVQWRGKKVGFSLGANFMHSGYRAGREPVPAGDPNAGRASERQLTYRNTYLEVPAELSFYQELDDNNEFFFLLGSGLSYNLNNSIYQILYDGEVIARESIGLPSGEYRRINYEFQAAMGWEKALNEQFSLVMQPHFQFWMRGILKQNDLNRNLYALGLRIAIKMKTRAEE